MNIIESIGSWGVVTTKHINSRKRLETVSPGDIIEFTDAEYPHNHDKYGRVASVNGNKVHICTHLGSAFLREDGGVSISGGPFEEVSLERLESTYKLHVAPFWNWGDNTAGADQGVTYHIERPLFLLNSNQ